MGEERKPLSLNERNARLVHDLSRSRPRSEIRVRKIKIEGRRRLCKISSADAESPDGKWLDSPTGENDDGESIRDILDDLTSRLDCLSVEKPKPMAREPEPSAEYESATSSLSPSSVHSSPAVKKEVIEKGKEVKDKAARVFSLDDDVEGREEEEDDCVVLGSGGKKQARKEEENEGESGELWSDDDVEDSDRDGKDGDEFTMAGSGSSKSRTYRLPERIFKMLYPHQRDGLKWLWALHCGDTGGILGDDMGLGKTMQELWALFNFCCPDILGDKDAFKIRYENPILRGNDKNASDREKHIGSTVAKELRERIKPYFLRRLKSEVFCEDDGAKNVKLSKKSEMIVWLKLTACQAY
ncbi:hypothetical protein BHE74_00012160 [Ensete ventricosum]|nr:hypothetical protein BHE74_00012160 [Ensete ventricosum]